VTVDNGIDRGAYLKWKISFDVNSPDMVVKEVCLPKYLKLFSLYYSHNFFYDIFQFFLYYFFIITCIIRNTNFDIIYDINCDSLKYNFRSNTAWYISIVGFYKY
jgi:hypothetical protein